MGFYTEYRNEITTLQLISQILGKIRLEYAPQEPQWAHVVLDITPRGFSTGLLRRGDSYFEIEADLSRGLIVIKTETYDTHIEMQSGKPISEYYQEIINTAAAEGLKLYINTKPQEMEFKTPFEDDVGHHHYNDYVANIVLKWFRFARDAEMRFLAPFRHRKVYPGLFWGTFDVSCMLVRNESEPFPDDSKVIERAAFDEYMIEFGFWLGDDTFEHPAFFTLPYPFVEKTDLEVGGDFPEGSYFSPDMAGYIYEIKDGINEKEAENVQKFLQSSFRSAFDHLKWKGINYCTEPLKMEDNQQGDAQD